MLRCVGGAHTFTWDFPALSLSLCLLRIFFFKVMNFYSQTRENSEKKKKCLLKNELRKVNWNNPLFIVFTINEEKETTLDLFGLPSPSLMQSERTKINALWKRETGKIIRPQIHVHYDYFVHITALHPFVLYCNVT